MAHGGGCGNAPYSIGSTIHAAALIPLPHHNLSTFPPLLYMSSALGGDSVPFNRLSALHSYVMCLHCSGNGKYLTSRSSSVPQTRSLRNHAFQRSAIGRISVWYRTTSNFNLRLSKLWHFPLKSYAPESLGFGRPVASEPTSKCRVTAATPLLTCMWYPLPARLS